MTQINAYLTFNGNCREAMTFYKGCLGGELNLQTVEGSPAEAQCPPEIKHQIMHSELRKDGIVLLASDMMPDGYKQGNTIALCVQCSSEEEINTFFSRFAEGGKITDPLKTQFWGAIFGAVNDKFGVRWLFNYMKQG
jgi:PhnB protein